MRVKTTDLLNIANFRLLQQGKRLVKSATTAWNRSKPRNRRSKQARKHIGKGLFCTKKPLKTEDNTVLPSDDKAYLRPGTTEGFEKTRNVKVPTHSNEVARHLPKYDWPESSMYQTPETHRILNNGQDSKFDKTNSK